MAANDCTATAKTNGRRGASSITAPARPDYSAERINQAAAREQDDDTMLREASAIVMVVARLYGGEYPDNRPIGMSIFMPLGVAQRKLESYRMGLGASDAESRCGIALDGALSLLDLLNHMGWEDEWEVTFGDNVMTHYLEAVGREIDRAIAVMSGGEPAAPAGGDALGEGLDLRRSRPSSPSLPAAANRS